MSEVITKLDAARRQLDTAIDLYFNAADSLSVYTLAYASFKVLFDIYPHNQNDGFDKQLDEMIRKEGWKALSNVANFLKHADRDPHAILSIVNPERGYHVIVLATVLFRRVAGEHSRKMEAFDCWVESTAADELGIPEIDENVERAKAFARIRDALKAMPHAERIKFAREHYEFYLEHRDRIHKRVKRGQEIGESVQSVLDAELQNFPR